MPAGKALLVPLIAFFVDNVGRDEPQSDRELEDEAHEILLSVRDLTLRVGGQELDRPLEDWIVPPTRSDYDLPSGTNVYSCAGLKDVTGKIEPSYYGGVFVLFPPPEPGTYTIEYGGAATGFGSDYVSVVRSTFVVQ